LHVSKLAVVLPSRVVNIGRIGACVGLLEQGWIQRVVWLS